MLSNLSIRDVVLIDHLDLEFQPGLCALTGETGAGKSILLDALGLSLGARADSGLVRKDAPQAVVTASFDVGPGHPALSLLSEHGIDGQEDGLVLRRTLGRDGRSRAYINDQPVSVSLLRRIGEALVEIHGQFESQRLLDPATHRALLDAYGGLEAMTGATKAVHGEWRRAADARSRAEVQLAAARRDEDFLRHAVEELDALEPRTGEEDGLAQRRTLMMNSEKLMEALSEAGTELAGGNTDRGVEDSLRIAVRLLERVAEKADGRLDEVIGTLDRALSEISEGLSLLDKAVADLDLDPGRLEEVEERLFALRALARKHQCTVDDLAPLRDDLAAKLSAMDDGADGIIRLAREEEQARERYRAAVTRLSEARAEAAARLDTAVAGELDPLRLGKARFRTRIETLAETSWGEHGGDRVTFEVATNPGMPPGPLNKIASGGELSRFMLALKVVLAQADPVPTLVFDEVDSGVSGAVSAAVGERLALLAGSVQVLVLTHSPQVAARGGYHWRVSKSSSEVGTRTSVEVLDNTERTEEIARMLAGARVTDEARAAAESLLLGATG